MKQNLNKNMFRCAFALAICLLMSGGASLSSINQSVEKKFQNPPHDAKALTWWHWTDGNITCEGITSDLEAMDEAGLAGTYMFNVEQGVL